MITTACHCGAVRIGVPQGPPSVTECNCSICLRYGAMWAYYMHAEVEIACAPDATSAYVWGDRTIAFHHCRNCGCVTHYETIAADADSLFAVNVRAMWPDLLAEVPVRPFDGAVSWTYLDED